MTWAHKLSEDVHRCESDMQLFWRALVGWWRRRQAALRTSSQLPLLGMQEWGSAPPPLLRYFIKAEIICACLLWPISIHVVGPPQAGSWGLALMCHVLLGGSHHRLDRAGLPLTKRIFYLWFWRRSSHLDIYCDRMGASPSLYLS